MKTPSRKTYRPEKFVYDVFLSHSSKDKTAVHKIAVQLRNSGLEVWLDEWMIKPGDNIPFKIDEGLEQSRVLLLCMSKHAVGSDWAELESQTYRFRDPLNRQRRFIPLRLDNAQVKSSLNQFLYIDWRVKYRKTSFAKLIEVCSVTPSETTQGFVFKTGKTIRGPEILSLEIDSYRHLALAGKGNGEMHLLDTNTGDCMRVFKGHTGPIWGVALSPNQRHALSCGSDKSLRTWDVSTGNCLYILESVSPVNSAAWMGPNLAISCDDRSFSIWDTRIGVRLANVEIESQTNFSIAIKSDRSHFLLGVSDTVQLYNVESLKCVRVLEGHTGELRCVIWSPDQKFAASGGMDGTIRIWNIDTGHCNLILRGHTGPVWSLSWHKSQSFIISGSGDNTMRLWDLTSGKCVKTIKTKSYVRDVTWDDDQRHAFTGEETGLIQKWELFEATTVQNFTVPSEAQRMDAPKQVQYTNAKVLLVGESGAGKTGLSKRLALDEWQPSDSTLGAWATQWELSVAARDGFEREIWLWDFGGQADQRLIHQLYMDETALAVLVFDGQKDDLFETLGHWDRDLTTASRREFTKLLVVGRIDAGGLRASKQQLDQFARERNFKPLLQTSAKTGEGCESLKQAILNGINWEAIPWRTSPTLFKQLKEEIIRLKDTGRILIRFNELRDSLKVQLAGQIELFGDDELAAVIRLLAGPGAVWELQFGSWILLQPEMINIYAQAVIQALRADDQERGYIDEQKVLEGDLKYQSADSRVPKDDERIVLLAMHQVLVERALCLREPTETGTLLIFPSYYRRERPELTGHPAIQVSYRFHGFLDEIYATLVVRLHHTQTVERDSLWRYAADFKTLTGKKLGLKLTRLGEGAGELAVYFDPTIPIEERIIFSKYVHEHVVQKGKDVTRLRHYVCPHCGTPAGNLDVAMDRLSTWLRDHRKTPTMLCVQCEDRFDLWDQMEQYFASGEARTRVIQLQDEIKIVLDNESKERALVGDVISTVALAGQLARELTVSDHGIDMEIEFKSDTGEATGKKLYLQLKSGDSYLKKRSRDEVEIFRIPNERHAQYWAEQAFPVMLIIRNSEGEVRWMEVRAPLKQAFKAKTFPREIAFSGERFDVMSVRKWRQKALAAY